MNAHQTQEDFRAEIRRLVCDMNEKLATLDEQERKILEEYRERLAKLHIKNILNHSHD